MIGVGRTVAVSGREVEGAGMDEISKTQVQSNGQPVPVFVVLLHPFSAYAVRQHERRDVISILTAPKHRKFQRGAGNAGAAAAELAREKSVEEELGGRAGVAKAERLARHAEQTFAFLDRCLL